MGVEKGVWFWVGFWVGWGDVDAYTYKIQTANVNVRYRSRTERPQRTDLELEVGVEEEVLRLDVAVENVARVAVLFLVVRFRGWGEGGGEYMG